jgi:hypothetical protein
LALHPLRGPLGGFTSMSQSSQSHRRRHKDLPGTQCGQGWRRQARCWAIRDDPSDEFQKLRDSPQSPVRSARCPVRRV